MPVIINEFEVVPEPTASAAETPAAASAQAPKPAAADFEKLIDQRAEREVRIRAY